VSDCASPLLARLLPLLALKGAFFPLLVPFLPLLTLKGAFSSLLAPLLRCSRRTFAAPSPLRRSSPLLRHPAAGQLNRFHVQSWWQLRRRPLARRPFCAPTLWPLLVVTRLSR